MDGASLTPEQEKLNALKQVLPEVFTEGKVDWEKLKATLGEDINFSNERYVLNWAGKSEAFKVLQAPTTKTLVPAKDESVNFDDTEHIFIEGENMEVLKVLQKSYFGKVKMIYIDPPYNTGNDSFIYPDKFSETKSDYEKRVGDKDGEGYMTKDGMFKKNSKENGQYHSNWLNMMMPRLFLAKNLLRKDGVIFISIDDNEIQNLRLLMNEVFGEENFIEQIIWRKKSGGGQQDDYFVTEHDYILCYCKDSNVFSLNEKTIEKTSKGYNKVDEISGKKYKQVKLAKWGSAAHREDRPTMYFPLIDPDGNENYPIAPDGRNGRWRYGRQSINEMVENDRIEFVKNNDNWIAYEKEFEPDADETKILKERSIFYDLVENTSGSKELTELFGSKDIFDNPKPTDLLQHLILLTTEIDTNDIVLDFFAGAGSTGNAVLKQNLLDGGNRKFVCVQLPEKTKDGSKAKNAGFNTISEVSIKRLQLAIDFLIKDYQEYSFYESEIDEVDLGFKVLKLADSNFKQWQQITGKDKQALEEQMKLFVDPVAKNATTENMVYELLLKSGKDLNSTIEAKDGFYAINETELVLILEKANQEIIDAVIANKPQKVIALDKLFKGNDQLKTNASLQMKDAGIEFKTI
ncbi:site-specific DNA-methyltransferase [Avrilella dinanensis]|uniref:site-specific DNA-methyltransferase n=1 Tax=Avrilella dinanensis TaxID=2008672 RepID=UPI002409698F|nr:site-specific DNA-methyltransferase [Avrilella dinanensis]